LKKSAIAVIIPSYEPSEKLPTLVAALRRQISNPIVIVNDGSKPEKYQCYFDQLESTPDVVILRHKRNRGKGRALKTAFAYCLLKEFSGAVTADEDGQHLPEDICRCVAALEENPDSLILGVRSFQEKGVPVRSKLGNLLTCRVFKILTGQTLSDTQTGLRGLPAFFIEKIQKVSGERFEYETKMLLIASSLNIPFKEVEISTIYEKDNTTHFRPFKDSWLIYITLFGESLLQLFYFFSSGIMSFLIDISVFTLFYKLIFRKMDLEYFNMSLRLLLSIVLARCVSATVNYTLNRNFVFKNKGLVDAKSLLKFFGLASFMVLLSYILTETMLALFNSEKAVLTKICVDSSLVCVTFLIQKFFVFKPSGKSGKV